jgi:hypothetical protein
MALLLRFLYILLLPGTACGIAFNTPKSTLVATQPSLAQHLSIDPEKTASPQHGDLDVPSRDIIAAETVALFPFAPTSVCGYLGQDYRKSSI